MQIVLNGESLDIAEGMSVKALVLTLADDPRGVAIERNLESVPTAEHATTLLEEGERVEIVQFVGGSELRRPPLLPPSLEHLDRQPGAEEDSC